MNSDRVELIFHSTQQLPDMEDVALVMLTDMDVKRQISIFCDMPSKYQIDLRTHSVRILSANGEELATPPAELTRLMLPEVLCSIINYMTELQLQVVITNVYEGKYHVVIEDAKTGTTFPVRASDGILLALAHKHMPIYIDYDLWKYQSLPLIKDNTGVALPINTLTDDLLKSSFEKCIAEENYEQAKQLKEEIDRRKRK